MLKELVNHVGGAELETWLRRAVKSEVNAKGVCLCGPSGTGKSALVSVLKVAFPEMVVAATGNRELEPWLPEGDCRGKIVVFDGVNVRRELLNHFMALCEVANVMVCRNKPPVSESERNRRFDPFTQESPLPADIAAAVANATEADVAGFRAWLLG